MRKQWLIGGVATVLAVAIASVVASRAMSSGDGKKDKGPEVALEFTAQEVVRPLSVAMPLRIEFSGPLVAPRTAIVRAKAAGTLVSLNVGEGSRVRSGQPLGVIDLSDLQSRLTDRSAAVESAQAAHAEADRQHSANVGLAAQKFISPTALQTSQARLDAASAQLKSSQAQLSMARTGIREAALTAPISGVVSKRNVVPGEKLSMEQPILAIVDLGELELAGAVGTHEVSRLTPGMAVEVRVEGAAQPVAGKLVRIAPAAEPGTRDVVNPLKVSRTDLALSFDRGKAGLLGVPTAEMDRAVRFGLAGLTARSEPDGVAIARLMAALDAPGSATETTS